MTFIFVFLFLGLIGLVASLFAMSGGNVPSEDARGRTQTSYAGGAIAVALLMAVLNLGWTATHSIHIIEEKEIGVVRTFGKITGTVDKGAAFTMPWQSVEKWSAKLQFIKPEESCSNGSKNCLNAGSIDIQDVYVQATANLNVNKATVVSLASQTSDYQPIVQDRMRQVIKAIISEYKAESILEKREEIRGKVRDRLRTELQEKYSIEVDDVLITDIDFTDSYRQAIDAKVATLQMAQNSENQVKIKEAEARQKIAEAEGSATVARTAAQGRADSVLIEAKAQADANGLLTQSLTPQVLQLEILKKSGNIQWGLVAPGTTIVGALNDFFKSGSGVIPAAPAPAPAR